MPIVRIDIESGKSAAYKRAILRGVRSAITGALGVPDERLMQRLAEAPAEDIDAFEVRSDRLTIIEVRREIYIERLLSLIMQVAAS